MSVLRSLAFMLIAVVWTLVACPLILLCFWVPHRRRRRIGHLWTRPIEWSIRHVLNITYELRGAENVIEPAVILSKHQSAWETIVLQEIFHDVLFVWKRELGFIPLFGWAIATMPMISINRGEGKAALRQLVAQGKLRLSQGYSVVIFPEGTRVRPGEKLPYKIGGAFLAVAAGAPIVPVAMNAGELWRRNAWVKRPGKVVLSIGPRIDTTDISVSEANARAERWIENEMRIISPHLYPASAGPL